MLTHQLNVMQFDLPSKYKGHTCTRFPDFSALEGNWLFDSDLDGLFGPVDAEFQARRVEAAVLYLHGAAEIKHKAICSLLLGVSYEPKDKGTFSTDGERIAFSVPFTSRLPIEYIALVLYHEAYHISMFHSARAEFIMFQNRSVKGYAKVFPKVCNIVADVLCNSQDIPSDLPKWLNWHTQMVLDDLAEISKFTDKEYTVNATQDDPITLSHKITMDVIDKAKEDNQQSPQLPQEGQKQPPQEDGFASQTTPDGSPDGPQGPEDDSQGQGNEKTDDSNADQGNGAGRPEDPTSQDAGSEDAGGDKFAECGPLSASAPEGNDHVEVNIDKHAGKSPEQVQRDLERVYKNVKAKMQAVGGDMAGVGVSRSNTTAKETADELVALIAEGNRAGSELAFPMYECGAIQNGFLYPAGNGMTHDVCVLLDVSGSVVWNEAGASVLFTQLLRLSQHPNVGKVVLACYQSAVSYHEEFTGKHIDFTEIKNRASGGGGTSFDEAMTWVNNELPMLYPTVSEVFHLTDGLASLSVADRALPVTWISHKKDTSQFPAAVMDIHHIL